MIDQRLSTRAATEKDLLQVVNDEVRPVLSKARELINRMAAPALEAEVVDGFGAVNIDWRIKRHGFIYLDAPLTEVTCDDPTDAGDYVIRILQVGGGNTIGAWPANFRWPGAAAPTITATSGRYDLIRLYWDGALYLAQAIQDFG